MLRHGYYTIWGLKTAGGAIITVIIGLFLASWQTDEQYKHTAHERAYKAYDAIMIDRKDIDSLKACEQRNTTDKAVINTKLDAIDRNVKETKELVYVLIEKK